MAAKLALTFSISSGDGSRSQTIEADVPGVVKIGKLPSSQLRIDDDDVSNMHAVIEVSEGNEIQLIDLGSANGTVVNGEKISKVGLKDGDHIVLGSTTLTLHVAGAEAAVLASTPAVPPPVVAVPPPAGVSAQPAAASADMAPSSPAVSHRAPGSDGLFDKQDGSRAIEVTAMLQDSVLTVRHLDNPASGKVTGLTWVMLAIGVVMFLVGLVVTLPSVLGWAGLAAILLIAGLGFFVYGWTRRTRELASPHFVLGSAVDADLHIAHEAIPDAAFRLVESDGSDFSVQFTQAMQGDVTLGHERVDLSQLVSSGKAAQSGAAYSYRVPNDARVKLDFGDYTFLVNSVTPARTVPTAFLTTMASVLMIAYGASLAIHGLIGALVVLVPPDEKSLSLDLFDTDTKFLKYLNKPPEDKEEDIPEWLKKKGPDEAGGKGQRHKGDQGKMGKKTSDKKTGLYGLKGPKDNPDPHLAKQLAEDAAQNAGVLGLIKSDQGSHLASIFGRDTALGTDAEDALGGLVGDQIGEAYGLGGLGMSGTGRGGGGTGEGTIGLGSLGTIGKGGGGGSGAGYGRGAGRLGGRRARAPKVLFGRAQVRGALDKEIIRRIIRRHIREVKFCYQKELQANESLGGRVVIQFTIAATGQVLVSKVQNSTIGNSKVEQCIAQAVRRWLFPKPKGGGIVIVSYPFVLRSAGG